MVGLVEAIGRLDLLTGAEYDVGLEPADLPADVPAQVEAVDEHAVRMFEDGQVPDADDGAGGLLLGGAQASRLLGTVRHAGLAAGEQEITDLDAARGPASDGRRRAVLHVVRVRDDAEHALEGLLGQSRQRHVSHPSAVPGRRVRHRRQRRLSQRRKGALHASKCGNVCEEPCRSTEGRLMTVSSATTRRVGSGLAAVVAATLALTTAPAPAAAASSATAVPPVQWSACTETTLVGFECGAVQVPLDYNRLRGAQILIALARRPATDPTQKIGTIFLNPGGPGGAGRGTVVSAATRLSPEVLARFDVVGFDPRGIGASSPIQCFATDAEAQALLDRMAAVPITREQISETLAANFQYTEACKRNVGPLLTHMSTLNVVKDLDRLRQAGGDRLLTYAGVSYGTLIGATYANVFPNRVGRLILDGNV